MGLQMIIEWMMHGHHNNLKSDLFLSLSLLFSSLYQRASSLALSLILLSL